METAASVMSGGRIQLVRVLVCAALCVAMVRVGLFSMLFLVPLGFSAVVYGAYVAWAAFAVAALGNLVLVAVLSLMGGLGLTWVGFEALYFGLNAAGFTWVMAGNPPWAFGRPLPQVRTLYRFVVASAAGTVMLLATSRLLWDGGLSDLVPMIEPLVSAYIDSASGGDAVMRSSMELALNPERLVEMVASVVFRGGALISAVLLLFFSRQAAFVVARLFRRKPGDLTGFFAPRRTLLILTVSLPAVLLAGSLSMATPEIVAWNVLVMCVVVFLAQGAGIVLFNLARRPLSILVKVLLGLLFAIVVFSPGLNLFALGVLLVLGIVENWLPMRRPKQDSPS
jgi:hypothetical protein